MKLILISWTDSLSCYVTSLPPVISRTWKRVRTEGGLVSCSTINWEIWTGETGMFQPTPHRTTGFDHWCQAMLTAIDVSTTVTYTVTAYVPRQPSQTQRSSYCHQNYTYTISGVHEVFSAIFFWRLRTTYDLFILNASSDYLITIILEPKLLPNYYFSKN